MSIQRSVEGWQAFMLAGKYPVLLLGMLLGLWMARGGRGGRGREGYFYGLSAVGTGLVIFPPVAALLMKYQTAYYEYVWIWCLIPMTAFLAWGLSVCGEGLLPRCAKGKRLALGALAVMVLWMCGRMTWQLPPEVTGPADREALSEEKEILEELAGEHESLLLWAPKETMEYARELTPRAVLVYGRDMWDSRLGSYTYEVYEARRQNLYEWMKEAELIDSRAGTVEEHEDKRDEEEMKRARRCGADAAQLGVNEILLPRHILPSWREALLEGLLESGQSWRESTIGGYWRYYVQE